MKFFKCADGSLINPNQIYCVNTVKNGSKWGIVYCFHHQPHTNKHFIYETEEEADEAIDKFLKFAESC